MLAILHACTMQKIGERKVMQRKIKDGGPLLTNVTIGRCSGYCLNASSVAKKPAN